MKVKASTVLAVESDDTEADWVEVAAVVATSRSRHAVLTAEVEMDEEVEPVEEVQLELELATAKVNEVLQAAAAAGQTAATALAEAEAAMAAAKAEAAAEEALAMVRRALALAASRLEAERQAELATAEPTFRARRPGAVEMQPAETEEGSGTRPPEVAAPVAAAPDEARQPPAAVAAARRRAALLVCYLLLLGAHLGLQPGDNPALATLAAVFGAGAATQQQAADSAAHLPPHVALAGHVRAAWCGVRRKSCAPLPPPQPVCAERQGCEARQESAAMVAPRHGGAVQPHGATRPEWLTWVGARASHVGGFLLPLVFWRRDDGRLMGERR